MAVDFDQLIEVTKRTLGAGQTPETWAMAELDLSALKGIACERVAHHIAMDTHRRSLLQQDYSVTLNASGVGDLLAAVGSVTAAADIIWDSVCYNNVQDADNNSLVYIPHLHDFYRPAPVNFAYYTLADRKIRTRALATAVNSAADIVTVNGPVIVTANFETSDLTYWPNELFGDLVEEICGIAQAKFAAVANA